jgi:tetratricopeptide (TPR) repeat protein
MNLAEQSIHHYTTVLLKNPKDADALFRRGRAYAQLGQVENAQRDFDEAIKIMPDAPEYHLARAENHVERHDPEKAIADFTRALELTPDASKARILEEIYQSRAVQYRLVEDYYAAIDDYTALMQLRPDKTAAILVERGNLYLFANEDAHAVQDFYASLEMNDTNPLAMELLIEARMRLKDMDGLKDDYAIIRELHPNKAFLQFIEGYIAQFESDPAAMTNPFA